MKTVMVWVADWQMQCCGTPFEIGDIINWDVVKWTFGKLPVSKIPDIDYSYENHGDKSLVALSGTVHSIDMIYQIYELNTEQNAYIPVSGKTEKSTKQATGWESNIEDYRFSGYLVSINL